jgi:6-pyruvoyltetrahydropterin/6-carboxytetrahydropterin synthase
MIFLTRRATFSASHFYWNPAWNAEKNEQVFGRCANRNGHGHNYTLEVTVSGEPDPEFAASESTATNPTTENIAIAAWKRLEPAVTGAGGAHLTCVRIYETPEIFAEYRGQA